MNYASLLLLLLLLLYSKLEYESVAWNSIKSTDSSKLERVKEFFYLVPYQIFAGVCYSNCKGILARLNISTLHSRRKHLDALFLINVFKNKINCSSIFDTISLQIPARIIRDLSTSVVSHNFKVSPLAKCVSAANVILTRIKLRSLISLNFAYTYTC
jgi:hypothetical protein